MNLTYKNELFYLECDYADHDLVRRAGFCWDKNIKKWITPFAANAAKICRDKKTRDIIIEKISIEKKNKIAGNAVYGTIEVPVPPDLKYLPYQLAGIRFMLDHKKVLLADQMGLGKTIQVIGLCNLIKPKKILIVCPASLKYNWYSEWKKWCTYAADLIIAKGKSGPDISNIVIINYDILKKHHKKLRSIKWDMIVLDECQYLKNPKAQRTMEVVGGLRGAVLPLSADRIIALTGTPVVNKPIELFPILNYLLPHGFSNRMNYAKRYCSAFQNRWGWDMSGSSNLEELQDRLRSTIMIRRLKETVLQDLPDKVRQIIEFEEDTKAKKILLKEDRIRAKVFFAAGICKEKELLNDKEYREVVRLMSGGMRTCFEEMAAVRKETALAKLPMVIKHLEDCLEAGGKIVCFCHHRETAKEIYAAFSDKSVIFIGGTSLEQRNMAVINFQSSPKIKLFIGNIQAAGTGLTLTAASHVVFAELSWVPGEISQAEDRCHRIGQKDSVLVQHLVLKGSIDANMAKIIIKKQELIEKIVDIKLSDKVKEMLK